MMATGRVILNGFSVIIIIDPGIASAGAVHKRVIAWGLAVYDTVRPAPVPASGTVYVMT